MGGLWRGLARGMTAVYIAAMRRRGVGHSVMARVAAALWLAAGLASVSCSKSNSHLNTAPEFDGERAFADLVKQVEFGPRIPGSDGHAACAAWLLDELGALADSAWEQTFTGNLPGITDSVPMVNLIGRFAAERTERILLGAHWDTRPHADRDPDPAKHTEPVPGANDGGSGVAVLLEIARLISRDSGTLPPVGVDIVLFDGEDAGRYSHDNEWSQGARFCAAQAPAAYQYVIIVDMVGDANLELYREGYSFQYARPLQDRIWEIARTLGEAAFRPEVQGQIIDDHLPFLMRGTPAVDIIDLSYPAWHTVSDTPDKCSAASLRSVGRVVVQTIFEH